jgi:hypothetical protein
MMKENGILNLDRFTKGTDDPNDDPFAPDPIPQQPEGNLPLE